MNLKDRNIKENKSILSILLVESAIALSNLDKILECDGIDLIYIGTYDLSYSIGTPGNIYSKGVMDALESTDKVIRDRGIACGVLSQSAKDVKMWVEMGFQFIPYIVDCGIIFEAFEEKFREFKMIIRDSHVK